MLKKLLGIVGKMCDDSKSLRTDRKRAYSRVDPKAVVEQGAQTLKPLELPESLQLLELKAKTQAIKNAMNLIVLTKEE